MNDQQRAAIEDRIDERIALLDPVQASEYEAVSLATAVGMLNVERAARRNRQGWSARAARAASWRRGSDAK